MTIIGATRSAIKNSTAHACSKCGRQCWLAPSGEAKRTKHNMAVICMYCIPGDVEVKLPTYEELKGDLLQ